MQSDLTKFYEKQISLTEWFEAIGHPQAAALRLEDNDKRERLAVLNKLIGLPFDKPVQFSASDVAGRSPAFKKYLAAHGDELCAVRIMPDDPSLPKLRMRGHSVADGTTWFDQQAIDPAHYRVDFVPHAGSDWATIFIVSSQGMYGEITKGEHNELTQGLYSKHEPITFFYNYKTWRCSKQVPGLKQHLQDIIAHLHVADAGKRKKVENALQATFANNYLCGYFETTASAERGIWFIDYNRILHKELNLGVAPAQGAAKALVAGRCASPGKATGTVSIVTPDQLHAKLGKDTILVCSMTTPDYLPLMQQAVAIVTDLGGVLSHAAIIARELKKPCLTGTGVATTVLKNGQKVIVDATAGLIVAG